MGEKPVATVGRFREFAEHQAGPALATIVAADAGDLTWLSDMLARSKERTGDRHVDALRQDREGERGPAISGD